MFRTHTFLKTGRLWSRRRGRVNHLERWTKDLELSRWHINWKAFREVVDMVKRADARIGVVWWDDSPAAEVEEKVGEAAREAASEVNES